MTVDEFIEKLEPYRGYTLTPLYWNFDVVPDTKDVTLGIGDADRAAKELIIDVEDVKFEKPEVKETLYRCPNCNAWNTIAYTRHGFRSIVIEEQAEVGKNDGE